MKVLKVIVDEVPKGCGDCQFLHKWERGRSILFDCDATFEGFIDDLETRPDWCPLITAEQILHANRRAGIGAETIEEVLL